MSQFTNEVLGPLTDVELRAAAVPVSGPLTDTQLRATAVPVSGPLTDAQLRATPVPISGTVATTQGGVPTATVARITVSTTVATLQASNPNRKRLVVFNESGTLFVKLGSTATATDYSYRLTANTGLDVGSYTGVVTGIKASGSSAAQVTEIA